MRCHWVPKLGRPPRAGRLPSARGLPPSVGKEGHKAMPRPTRPLSDARRLGGMAATSKGARAAGREVGSHVLGAGGVDVDLPKIFSKAPAVIRSKTSLKCRQSLSVQDVGL